MTAFSNRRVQYDIETRTASNETKQQEWEEQIQVELAALKDFILE